MVGIFSRFSVSKNLHRRSQSALDLREAQSPTLDSTADPTVSKIASPRGLEVAVEFKPIEHPIEPLGNDQPIQCPIPDPSILNDRRIWEERISAGSRRREDLPVIEIKHSVEPEAAEIRIKPQTPSDRLMLPSISAPEHDILKLLEECNTCNI